jgi:hypothetical protein
METVNNYQVESPVGDGYSPPFIEDLQNLVATSSSA